MYKILLLLIINLWLEANYLLVVSSDPFPATTLSSDRIRAIYLSMQTWIDDTPLLAINYPPDDRRRVCFEQAILKKSRASLRRYWLKAHYNGHRPPKVVKSSAALHGYLRQIPGAIGYLDANDTLPDGVKILYRIQCP